jgi:hypothetical protein
MRRIVAKELHPLREWRLRNVGAGGINRRI